jgi:two-component system chemotaxis response regulator CheB
LALQAAARILIVDDSAVARAVIARAIEPDTRFRVAGAVAHVEAALAFLAADSVDIILLDVAMPGMDGITALPRLLAAGGDAPILIVSGSTPSGGAAAVQALAHGAADTLVKPQPQGLDAFGTALLGKLEALTGLGARRGGAPSSIAPPPPRTGATAAPLRPSPKVIGIGASTGGIHALAQLLSRLGADMAVPIVVTQHLPASFTPFFAAQLANMAGRPCDVAEDRLRLRAGRIIVAPGDAHVTFVRLAAGGTSIRLLRDPVPSGYLPSVDPMFASMADIWGADALGVVLTGMGRDGLEGARMLKRCGGTVIAQDRSSSVVWGMPGAVVGERLADAVLPPHAIGAMLGAMGQ